MFINGLSIIKINIRLLSQKIGNYKKYYNTSWFNVTSRCTKYDGTKF